MKSPCIIFMCILLALFSLGANTEEVVFEKKLPDGSLLTCYKQMLSQAQPASKESLKEFQNAFGDNAKAGGFTPPQYLFTLWLDTNLEKKRLWVTQGTDVRFGDSGFRYESRDLGTFKIFDATFESGSIVVVTRQVGAVCVDIVKAGEKAIHTSQLTDFWLGKKSGDPKASYPKASRVVGSFRENNLAVIIDFASGKTGCWHWDGKEWIEVKKSDQ